VIEQPLHPTKHREPTSPEHPEQKTKSMPSDDAHANKTFLGPAGVLKSARGVGRQSRSGNRFTSAQGAHQLQRARKRTK